MSPRPRPLADLREMGGWRRAGPVPLDTASEELSLLRLDNLNLRDESPARSAINDSTLSTERAHIQDPTDRRHVYDTHTVLS
jgi:hypothetical protein